MKAARKRIQLTPHQKSLRRAKVRSENRKAKMWGILSGQPVEKKANINPWSGLGPFTVKYPKDGEF